MSKKYKTFSSILDSIAVKALFDALFRRNKPGLHKNHPGHKNPAGADAKYFVRAAASHHSCNFKFLEYQLPLHCMKQRGSP